MGSGCVSVNVWDGVQRKVGVWMRGSLWVYVMEYSKALGPTQACGNVGCAHFDCNGRLGCDPWEPVGVMDGVLRALTKLYICTYILDE